MTPRRFIARVLVACVLISAAAFMAVAEPLRPLRIGYIVNGPERSVFEEQFEFGLRDNGYVPANPKVLPLDPSLLPNGTDFKGVFYTPEKLDEKLPIWDKIFQETFK
jgi:hypothetical protein